MTGMDVKSIIGVISGYFDRLGFKYRVEDELIITVWEIEGRPHVVLIVATEKMVGMRSKLLEPKEVPEDPNFFKELLKAHHLMSNVRYDMDGDGNLGVSASTPIEALNFESFRIIFLTLLFAIEEFWKDIAPKFGLK